MMRPGAFRTRIFLHSFLAIALTGVVGLAACGGGGSSSTGPTLPPTAPPPATGTGITVFPGTANVPLGGKATFTAYVPSAPKTTTFTWAVTGGSANGTITTDGAGNGDYVAPATMPSGAVTVTVTSGSSLAGSATVTITAAAAGGVTISPASIAIPAGTTFPFSATGTVTSWEVNGTPNGDTLHGMIDNSGNYIAPAVPPPGGSTTITAVTASASATSNVTIVFSNNSLSGPYAYSYTGDDGSGYLAVVGSFNAQSGVVTGSEDATDVSGGGATASAQISGTTAIGPDGRGTITIAGGVFATTGVSGETWQIALTSNPAANPGAPVQHALLMRFDVNGTGSGTIDRQNTIEAGSPFPMGDYAFGLSGLDGAPFKDRGGAELVTAGKFFSNGNNGSSANSSEWDVNDAGFSSTAGIVTSDTTLTATFQTSPITGSVGRGTMTLFSTNTTISNMMTAAPATSTFTFVFYVIDNTHVKVIETDKEAFLSGDIYSAPSAPYAATGLGAVLRNGNYAFTLGGVSGDGPYSAGGVFGVNGGTETTAGVMDINNGGVQIPLDKTLSVLYNVDSLGRIAFTFSPTGDTTGYTVAAYATSNGPVEMVETDTRAVASGVAYPQSSVSEPSGSYGVNISGASTTGAQALGGQVSVTNGAVSGTLDFSDFLDTSGGAVDPGLQLLTGTTIATPDANGRGTGNSPFVFDTSEGNFQLVYYLVSPQTVLLMETDGNHVILGSMGAQF